eukprot:UN24172
MNILNEDNISNITNNNTKILHILTHGTKDTNNMVVESMKNKGQTEFCDLNRLRGLVLVDYKNVSDILRGKNYDSGIIKIIINYCVLLPELVVIQSRYASNLGNIFLQLGISNVITITNDYQTRDEISLNLVKILYENLIVNKKSLGQCEDICKKILNDTTQKQINTTNKSVIQNDEKFRLISDDKNHIIFPNELEKGGIILDRIPGTFFATATNS